MSKSLGIKYQDIKNNNNSNGKVDQHLLTQGALPYWGRRTTLQRYEAHSLM